MSARNVCLSLLLTSTSPVVTEIFARSAAYGAGLLHSLRMVVTAATIITAEATGATAALMLACGALAATCVHIFENCIHLTPT